MHDFAQLIPHEWSSAAIGTASDNGIGACGSSGHISHRGSALCSHGREKGVLLGTKQVSTSVQTANKHVASHLFPIAGA